MRTLNRRIKSQKAVRILTALVLAAITTQSMPGARPRKIGVVGVEPGVRGSWALDQNGNNAWDGPVIDGSYFWSNNLPGESFVQGDWNGDGTTKMGVYLDGTWLLDYNGNGVWDEGVDKRIVFGNSSFKPVVGDWNGSGTTKIGVYNTAGTFLLDYNGNGVWDDGVDKNFTWTSSTPGDIPVVGDWNGDGRSKIGIYLSAGTWILDYNGNNAWDGPGVDKVLSWSTHSGESPVVGDWNGDGKSKIGVYYNGTWIVDYDGNYAWGGTSVDKLTFFGGPEWKPIVGDWNGSGSTKIAAYSNGTWAIDVDGDYDWHPRPQGDVLTSFGTTGFDPIVGAWMQDFSISAAPLTIVAGDSGTSAATLFTTNGFSSAVTLTFANQTSWPAGVTASFSQNTINAPGSFSITIYTTTSTPVGTFPLTFTAVGGGVTEVGRVLVTVDPVFSAWCEVTPNPAQVNVKVYYKAHLYGGKPNYTFSFYGPFGYAYNAEPDYTPSQPTNTPIAAALDANDAAGRHQHMDCPYLLVFAGPDFSISKPADVTLAPGQSTSFTTTATAMNNFNLTSSPVATAWNQQQLPSGLTHTNFSPSPTSTSTTATINTTSNTPPGTYALFFSASSGSLSHTQFITVTVSTPGPSIQSSPSTRLVTRGGSVTFPLSLNGTGNSVLSFSLLGLPQGVTADFSQASATAPGAIGLTFKTHSSSGFGNYPITVIAQNAQAGLTLNATVTLNIVSQATIYTPAHLATLGGTKATFYWGGAGPDVIGYSLQVGTYIGASDILPSTDTGTQTYFTVNNLPSGGGPVWVRLVNRFPFNDNGGEDYYFTSYAATVPSGTIQFSSSAVASTTGANRYLVTVTTSLTDALTNGIGQVQLYLQNAKPGQGFACHAIADTSTSVLQLADDLGEWWPNPNDRYTPGLQLLANKTGQWLDWPNNTQCSLREQESTLSITGGTVTTTFSLELKSNIAGPLAILAQANCSQTVSPCSNSPLVSLDALPLTPVNQTAQILPMGFKSNTGSFRVDGGSGNRDVFYLRFAHPQGVQQLKFVYLNISPSTSPSVSPACQVTVNPLTEMIWIDGPGQFSNGVAAGSNQILQNASPCTVYAQTSRIQFLSPTEVLVRLDIGFSNAWNGLTLNFFRAFDAGLGRTTWAQDFGYTYPVPNAPSSALSLVSFKACLDGTLQPLPSECVLASSATPYLITQTLWIARSNVIIRGESKTSTILQKYRTDNRDDALFAMTDPIMRIRFGPGIGPFTNITIRDLTFDGNRTGRETVEPAVFAGLQNAPEASGELEILNVTGSTTSGYPGMKVINCRFINSATSAVTMHPPINYPAAYPNGTPTKGIVFQNNEFTHSLRAPIHISLAGGWSPQSILPSDGNPLPPGEIDIRSTCDVSSGNENKFYTDLGTSVVNPAGTLVPAVGSSVGLPAEAVNDVLVQNNFFENNDTGAFGITSSIGIVIKNNAMLNNMNNGWDCGGGVVAILSCGRTVTVDQNFIWNRDVYGYSSRCASLGLNPNLTRSDQRAQASGLELWGHNISVTNNWIEYFTTEGIFATSVQKLTVSGNTIRNASRQFQASGDNSTTVFLEDDKPGIQIANCNQNNVARPVDTISILNNSVGNTNSIYQSYGIRVRQAQCGVIPTETMTNVNINSNSGENRQGLACVFGGLQGSLPLLSGCNDDVTFGYTLNGKFCGTAGCK